MITNIKFGTSGWRAVIAEDLTYSNLKRVVHAIAKHIKLNKEYGAKGEEYRLCLKKRKTAMGQMPPVVIGYDTRYMSEVYARIAAESLISENIPTIISDSESPTPAVAWNILRHNAIGGIMITASHNPPKYNGVKWSPFWGGPAIPEITTDIENLIGTVTHAEMEKKMSFRQSVAANLAKKADFASSYLAQLEKLVDLKKISKSGIKIACDYNYGAARNYLPRLFEKYGIKSVHIRTERDVTFGGSAPDTGKENLLKLSKTVKSGKFSIGIAMDGDADRFGIVDSDGAWVSPNHILALILDYLAESRKMTGKVARSVMTSGFLDAVAKLHGMEVRETPVGFKHIGNLLRSGDYILGGEESAGMSIKGHVPEKDGILACLLAAEMVAAKKKPVRKLLAELQRKTGPFFNERLNLPVKDMLRMEKLVNTLQSSPPLRLAGEPVWRINEMDGFKFILKDGTWLGIRPSGTEPVVRVYAESSNRAKLKKMLDTAEKIILSDK